MTDIQRDSRNVNRHSDRGKAAVKSSLAELGAGRSILIDSSGTLIAGENTFERAQELGIPVKIIDSDGSELIAVRRNDLGPDDPRRRLLAIADNKTGSLAELDFDLAMAELAEIQDIQEIDLTLSGFDDIELRFASQPASSSSLVGGKTATESDSGESQTSTERHDGQNQGGTGPAAQPVERSEPRGDQTGGRAIFFGQDQLSIVESAIAKAREEQGDEASESELIIWCLLQFYPNAAQ